MKKLFAFLFGVTLVGQAWAQTTTILRQDDNQTTNCYFSSNYFQFDFNSGASFEISYDGVIIYSTECSPVEEYSATFGACVRNFVKNGATIEFDLLDGEYSTTQFAHYITRFPAAVSAFAENGIVSIEGSNAIGQTITLTVTPNDDYEFNCWSDGNTDNPRTINITSNMDLKAVCLTEGQTLVNLTVTAGENGTVSGGGVYGSGISASLRAIPNTGYHFVRWNDDNTDNPRTVAVTEDATFTAEFEEHTVVIDDAAEPPTTLPGYGYTEGSHCSICGVTINRRDFTYWKQITTSAENGSVSGAGIYHYGQTVTLTATPNEGCTFSCWSDGNTENPRTVLFDWGSEISDYKAICLTEEQTIANLTVSAGNNGTATGGGAFISGTETTFTLQATPNTGYHFVRWNDGNTDNPRTVAATEDATFTAEFEEHTIVIDAAEPPTSLPGYGYTEGSHCSVCGVTINQQNYTSDWKQITTSAENGSVSGAGICHYGQTVTLTATPNEGCTFSCWSDGNTDNPRTVSIDWVDYKAICLTEGQTIANLTVSAGNNGTATGGGAFISGTETTFTLQAKPNTGYHFVRWSDGNTDNPRTLTVSTNKTLTAEFEAHNAVIDAAVPAGTRPGLTQGSHCSVCNMVMEPQEIIYIIGVYSFEIHGEDYHPEVNNGNDDRFIEPDSPVFPLHVFETDANDWDSQFFIVISDELLNTGTSVDVRFDYRKFENSGVVKFNAQGHTNPHSYVNNDGWETLEATEEWQTYEGSFEVTSEIRTLAVNASIGRENGTLLLRNIVVKVKIMKCLTQ